MLLDDIKGNRKQYQITTHVNKVFLPEPLRKNTRFTVIKIKISETHEIRKKE